MTSALEGGRGVVEEWTRVLISCVIMYVTRGRGSKNPNISRTSYMESPLVLLLFHHAFPSMVNFLTKYRVSSYKVKCLTNESFVTLHSLLYEVKIRTEIKKVTRNRSKLTLKENTSVMFFVNHGLTNWPFGLQLWGTV